MTMSFTSLLRGRIAERILVTLFERGGFRVTRLGIEELFDEVKLLPQKQYLDLGLPPSLRTMPDLLIADAKVTWAKMVEVKFRSRFDLDVVAELHATLTEQRHYWPESYAVVMVGEPPGGGGRFHQDHIRVVGPNEIHKLDTASGFPALCPIESRVQQTWDSLSRLTQIVPHMGKGATEEERSQQNAFWSAADDITRAIRELGKI